MLPDHSFLPDNLVLGPLDVFTELPFASLPLCGLSVEHPLHVLALTLQGFTLSPDLGHLVFPVEHLGLSLRSQCLRGPQAHLAHHPRGLLLLIEVLEVRNTLLYNEMRSHGVRIP